MCWAGGSFRSVCCWTLLKHETIYVAEECPQTRAVSLPTSADSSRAFTSGGMAGGCSSSWRLQSRRTTGRLSFIGSSSPAKHESTSSLWYRALGRGKQSHHLLDSVIILLKRKERPFFACRRLWSLKFYFCTRNGNLHIWNPMKARLSWESAGVVAKST